MNSTDLAASPSHASEYENLAECYKLPYGIIGGVCMILNFYGLIISTFFARSPWRPWHHLGYDSKALHRFSMSVGLSSLAYTFYVTGHIFLRCNLHYKLVVALTGIKVLIALATQGHSFTMSYLYRPSQDPSNTFKDEEAAIPLQQLADDEDDAEDSESGTSHTEVLQELSRQCDREWSATADLSLVDLATSREVETPPESGIALPHLSQAFSFLSMSHSRTQSLLRDLDDLQRTPQSLLDKALHALGSVANRLKRLLRSLKTLPRTPSHYLRKALRWFSDYGEPIDSGGLGVGHFYPLVWILLIVVLHLAYGFVGGAIYDGILDKLTDDEITDFLKGEKVMGSLSMTIFWILYPCAMLALVCALAGLSQGNGWPENCFMAICGIVFAFVLFGLFQALRVEFGFGVLVKNRTGLPMGGGVASPVALIYDFVVL